MEKSGEFSTPNYPSPYYQPVVCLWVIRIPNAKQISVRFDTFNPGSDGKSFLVYSKDGVFSSDKDLVTITNFGKKQFTFVGNTAFFEFISKGSDAKSFHAKYESSQQHFTKGKVGIRSLALA